MALHHLRGYPGSAHSETSGGAPQAYGQTCAASGGRCIDPDGLGQTVNLSERTVTISRTLIRVRSDVWILHRAAGGVFLS
jgi:hypothetical protein